MIFLQIVHIQYGIGEEYSPRVSVQQYKDVAANQMTFEDKIFTMFGSWRKALSTCKIDIWFGVQNYQVIISSHMNIISAVLMCKIPNFAQLVQVTPKRLKLQRINYTYNHHTEHDRTI